MKANKSGLTRLQKWILEHCDGQALSINDVLNAKKGIAVQAEIEMAFNNLFMRGLVEKRKNWFDDGWVDINELIKSELKSVENEIKALKKTLAGRTRNNVNDDVRLIHLFERREAILTVEDLEPDGLNSLAVIMAFTGKARLDIFPRTIRKKECELNEE